MRRYNAEAESKARFLKEVCRVNDILMELLLAGPSAAETDISVAEMPERHIILGGINDFAGSSGFHKAFMRFCREPHIPKLNLGVSTKTLYKLLKEGQIEKRAVGRAFKIPKINITDYLGIKCK